MLPVTTESHDKVTKTSCVMQTRFSYPKWASASLPTDGRIGTNLPLCTTQNVKPYSRARLYAKFRDNSPHWHRFFILGPASKNIKWLIIIEKTFICAFGPLNSASACSWKLYLLCQKPKNDYQRNVYSLPCNISSSYSWSLSREPPLVIETFISWSLIVFLLLTTKKGRTRYCVEQCEGDAMVCKDCSCDTKRSPVKFPARPYGLLQQSWPYITVL